MNISTQINRAIGYRILLCFFLAIVVLVAFTLNELGSSSTQLEKDLGQQCTALESFIISQTMVKNDDSIQMKLSALNENSNSKFYWTSEAKNGLPKKLQWQFPLSWVYLYPVKGIDGTRLGTLVVSGFLFNGPDGFLSLLANVGIQLLFFILIFIVLKPLNKRIPQRLFISPINDLLLLLSGRENEVKHKNLASFPEEINQIHRKIADLLENVEKSCREAAFGQIASQVAHDIRSPLLVLTYILNDLSRAC